MVSFWPFKGADSSPASFEKTLSALSTKIADAQARLDRLRSNSRRVKLLSSLYLTFAYLVYAIVLLLVVGYQNLGPWDGTGIAGGPVLIYLVRTSITTYYSYRVESLESRLQEYQAERAKTIQKLKDATKYDSTLELLEKYGGEKRPKDDEAAQDDHHHGSEEQRQPKGRQSLGPNTGSPAARTNLPPPPTANIQRPPISAPSTPQQQQHSSQHPQGATPSPRPQQPPAHDQNPTAEFAPNAGPIPTPYAQYESGPAPPRWYDRLMDLMLGEDETMPKNRLALICKSCRLVNGQAPPGTKSLADLGTWKCMSCGVMNGELDEGQKIVREVMAQKRDAGPAAEGSEEEPTSNPVKIEDGEQSEAGASAGTSKARKRGNK